MDHVLVDSEHMKRIKNVKSCRGAEIGSDHYMVKIEVQEEIQNDQARGSKKKEAKRLNYESIQEGKTQEKYIEKAEEQLTKIDQSTKEIDERWNQISKALKNAAMEVIPGKTENAFKKDWMDEECWKAVEQKKEQGKECLTKTQKKTENSIEKGLRRPNSYAEKRRETC